jgi:large repetitive protein
VPAAAPAPAAPLAPATVTTASTPTSAPATTLTPLSPFTETFTAPVLTNNVSVRLQLTFDWATKMAFSVNGGAFTAFQPYASSATVTLPGTDGTYTVTVLVGDQLGNTLVSTQTVQLDRTPPAAPSLSLNAADDRGTSSTDFVTNLSAPRVIVTGEAGATATVYVNGAVYTGQSLADGTYTLTAKLTDGAGNVSATSSHVLVIDTGAPVAKVTVLSTGLIVNNVLTLANNLVSLKLDVTETGSGAAQVSISLDGGVTWSVPQAYSSALTATLPADGSYTLVVRVTDVAGNVSQSAAQVLALDTTGPTIALALTAAPTGSYDLGASLGVTFSAADTTGVAWTLGVLDGQTWMTSGTAINVYSLTAGTHTFVVWAYDRLGNLSSVTQSFEVHATVGGLLGAVAYGSSQKLIGNPVQSQLSSTLQSAANALALGQTSLAKSWLTAFVNQVIAAGTNKIDSAYASLLLNWARDLIARLP